jgi:hypothetical protein
MNGLDLDTVDRLIGRRLGTFDVPCPLCGPDKSVRGQQRKVLRVWRLEKGFAGFCCARCGEHGHIRDRQAPPPDPVRLAKARVEAAEHARVATADRLAKARWLWSQRKPIAGSLVETYLRQARGYGGPLPATLGYLPPRGEHGPAMIAAFGLAHEVEPGVIDITDNAVCGVHLTRLLPDGSDRERGEGGKIMVGFSAGSPIVLAPPNDLLGMAVAEGIENAIAVHETTGLGAWAAGSASRMPALADAVPDYCDCLTIVADDDIDGRRHAATLADRVRARGIEVRCVLPNRWRAAS